MGFIEEDDFTSAYAEQLGYRKADNFILLETDSEVASLVPEDFARENRLLAVQKSDTTITVAMEDPEDLLSEDSVVYVPNEDKIIGSHREKDVVLKQGQYGMYVEYDNRKISLKSIDKVYDDISIVDVIDLLDSNETEDLDLAQKIEEWSELDVELISRN